MENITRSLIMAFSMLIFVIGFTYSMYLIHKLSSTANVLLDSVATTNYYDNLKVTNDNIAKRDVGADSIVSTLYRYYKEQYSVKIFVKEGSGTALLQIFDLDIEGKISKADESSSDDELKSLANSIFGDKNKGSKAYLFGAPWMGNKDQDARTRIDYFLNGEKGYINNGLVDYSNITSEGGFLKYATGKTFEESFIEYTYSGETVSTTLENGDESLETITGNTQENSKIVIIYTEK